MKTVAHSANKSFDTVELKSSNVSGRFKDVKKNTYFYKFTLTILNEELRVNA